MALPAASAFAGQHLPASHRRVHTARQRQCPRRVPRLVGSAAQRHPENPEGASGFATALAGPFRQSVADHDARHPVGHRFRRQARGLALRSQQGHRRPGHGTLALASRAGKRRRARRSRGLERSKDPARPGRLLRHPGLHLRRRRRNAEARAQTAARPLVPGLAARRMRSPQAARSTAIAVNVADHQRRRQVPDRRPEHRRRACRHCALPPGTQRLVPEAHLRRDRRRPRQHAGLMQRLYR